MITLLKTIDITELVTTYKLLEDKMHWTKHGTKGLQSSLQFKLGEDPWTSSNNHLKSAESEYSVINPFFQDTEFANIITEYKLLRTRFMWINPFACYSLHRDVNPRIHIPLITNPECYFVFPDSEDTQLTHLQAGNIYWVDTRKRHTFINCSPYERLHLVGVVEN